MSKFNRITFVNSRNIVERNPAQNGLEETQIGHPRYMPLDEINKCNR